jgi:hypothetical protein
VTPSSGRTVRHRLNRGGDRALNRAIHTIAMTRTRCCPTTRTYIARRTAEGKTPKEIRRCLKRYIARELYRTLTATITPTDHPALPLEKSEASNAAAMWSGSSPIPKPCCDWPGPCWSSSTMNGRSATAATYPKAP